MRSTSTFIGINKGIIGRAEPFGLQEVFGARGILIRDRKTSASPIVDFAIAKHSRIAVTYNLLRTFTAA